jgi:hypothetical protein
VSPVPRSLRELPRQSRIAFSRRQANRWAQQEEQQYPQPQYEQASSPAPGAVPDTVSQLKDLADLKAQGVLTDAEFEAQKAKILAS